MAVPNLLDCVIHWKKKIDRNLDNDDILLNVVRKLSKIPITFEILEATQIGKSIRNLSKRDDTVGENAKNVLSKWRKIVNLESTKSSKQKSISNEDNVIKKSSSKHDSSHIKTVHHHEKESSHESKEKHKKSSLHISSSKESLEKHLNANNLSKSSQSLDGRETQHLNKKNFHQNDVEGNIAWNPDSPETFLLDDKRKMSNSDDPHGKESLKRKLAEEKSDIHKHSSKKIKFENHSNSDGEKKKHPKTVEDKSVSHNSKKEHSSDKSVSHNSKKEHSSSSHSAKHSSSSHSKKIKDDNLKIKSGTESDTKKPKVKIQSSDGFTASSTTFEDCLGFNDFVEVKKKKSSKPKPSSSKNVPSDSVKVEKKSTEVKVLNNSSDKKVIENANASKVTSSSPKESVSKKSTVFDACEPSTSYSGMQSSFTSSQILNSSKTKKENHTNEDVIKFTSSRKEKTAIYSGRRNCNRSFPTLAQLCYRVLIENINELGPMGGAPYDLLKPILEKCTPNQLFAIERYNPYLLYDTNELWELHCKRDYKLLSPLEHETWRDVYLRGFDEREQKLKKVSANISASMSKATPVRQVKLAFIDSDAKPPREVLRRQAKHRLSSTNVASPVITPKTSAKKTETATSSGASSQNFAANKKDIMKTKETFHTNGLTNQDSLLRGDQSQKKAVIETSSNKSARSVFDLPVSDKDILALSPASKKPKIAPLMAKTLKTMKQCFRR